LAHRWPRRENLDIAAIFFVAGNLSISVMRDANNDLVAPYVHPKGDPNEAPSEMTVVDDPYGFDAGIGHCIGLARALPKLGRSREARPLQIAPDFAQSSVEVISS
jgi:hypothetical protein